jgi:hypothetical protein
VLEYVPSLFFALVFLACAWANWNNLLELTPAMRARRIPAGSHVSAARFVGGIAGAIACVLWPDPWLKSWWWVPFLVDLPGTIGLNRRYRQRG